MRLRCPEPQVVAEPCVGHSLDWIDVDTDAGRDRDPVWPAGGCPVRCRDWTSV